jgi:LuxR family transcriptional regulator, maltose regulon positive regulatory protein
MMAAATSALGRGQWELARDGFAAVIALGEDAAAWEGQAFAGRMLGQHDASFAAYERAYRLYRDVDDVPGAARVATWLGYNYEALRGDFAVASGWYARAHRLIDGRSLSLEHAWLAIREASRLLSSGLDPDRGRELAQLATAAAAAVGDVEVQTVGRSLEGLAMVVTGDVDAGLRLLDESATALIAGDLDTVLPASLACCFVIYGCEHAFDLARAAQWCRAIEESISARLRFDQFLGFCRCHYAAVMTARGELAEADALLDEAERAFATGAPAATFEVVLRRAEVRRRREQYDDARLLAESVAWHPDASRCLAAIALDSGDFDAAAELAERHLRRLPVQGRLVRVPGLAIAVSAHGRAGRLAAMDAAFDELSSAPRAGGIGTVVDAAAAERAEAHGDFDGARRLWEDAIDGSLGLGMRFEGAHARGGLARALTGLGRPSEAAIQSSRAATELAALRGGAQVGMLTSRERQVLQLVAEGLTDEEIAGRLLLSRHTVHRHVANVRTKLGQPSRAAAVAEATRRSLI